ncbi:MAG: phospholipase D-like domain-containing protein [Caulobacter sp.]|nr:phospholipase D-like domain-containing protein [Caulobacter sp.]
MRTAIIQQGGISARAIAGSHTVLLALDATAEAREGLRGFAIRRQAGQGAPRWLTGSKVFRAVTPNPEPGRNYSSREQPIQSLIWGDYTAKPGMTYVFRVVPLYGNPGSLTEGPAVELDVTTETEGGATHSIWFNRGAIASQAFAERFDNLPPPEPDNPEHEQTAWLSRGLLEACLRFIDETPAGDGLRVAAYEFTYPPIIMALKAAHERGVDLKVVYEAGQMTVKGERVDTEATKSAATALKAHGFPTKVLIKRTKRANIPHNKFIVRLNADRQPQAVWTGSTNFTPSGFLGQANVGHQVDDPHVAGQFLGYWEILAGDPEPAAGRAAVEGLTPDPPDSGPASGVTCVFSPRSKKDLLQWYAARIAEARQTVLFTGAFGVNETLARAFSIDRDFLRYILLEKPPTHKTKALLGDDRDLIVVPGQVLGDVWTKNKKGELTLRRPIPGFELERWFLDEEHYRAKGNIFFVHTKFMVIDPLSDDPVVITGSANFSDASLLSNDENMMVIRGNTRVADIYLTEFDRLIRHFYFRDIAAKFHGGGAGANAKFLDETDEWLEPYFRSGGFKDRRRRLFMATSSPQ